MLDIDIPRAADHARTRPAFALAIEALALRAVLDDVSAYVETLMVTTAQGEEEDAAVPVLQALYSVRLRIATGVLVASDIVETMR